MILYKNTEEVLSGLLPAKSLIRYEEELKKSTKWCDENKIKNRHTETTFLAYFKIKSETFKPSSMLKTTLSVKHDVHLDKCRKLIAFLKRQSDGYKPKKSEILRPI